MKDHELREIQANILEEVIAASEKHPEWPKNIFEGIAIITEEVGELAQAALDYKQKGVGYHQIEEEAVQVAAMGLRFLYHLEGPNRIEEVTT